MSEFHTLKFPDKCRMTHTNVDIREHIGGNRAAKRAPFTGCVTVWLVRTSCVTVHVKRADTTAAGRFRQKC